MLSGFNPTVEALRPARDAAPRELGMGDADARDEHDARPIRATCARCGEAGDVLPPEGYTFTKVRDLDEANAEPDRVTWKCRECGATTKTTLRRHKLTKVGSAVEAFREAMAGERPTTASDPIQAFKEAMGEEDDPPPVPAWARKAARQAVREAARHRDVEPAVAAFRDVYPLDEEP